MSPGGQFSADDIIDQQFPVADFRLTVPVGSQRAVYCLSNPYFVLNFLVISYVIIDQMLL